MSTQNILENSECQVGILVDKALSESSLELVKFIRFAYGSPDIYKMRQLIRFEGVSKRMMDSGSDTRREKILAKASNISILNSNGM